MPYRKADLMPDSFHHIYNRGVGRQPIFFDPDNWRYFLVLLHRYFVPPRAEIVAYCLMPNHYHLLVRVITRSFSADVMQPFSVSYTKAVNVQQARVGPLFQGPFKSVLVDEDAYLLHLSRYIHLNPVFAGLAPTPEDWAFSSYRDFVGARHGTLPSPSPVLGQFRAQSEYRQFVNAYLDTDRQAISHLLFD
jgi:putative transposase